MTNLPIIEYRMRKIEAHTTSWGLRIVDHYEAEALGKHYTYGATEESAAREGIQQYIRRLGAIPKEVDAA